MISIKYCISKFLKKINIAAIINSSIHKTSKVCSYSHIVECNIDRYTYVGSNCTLINCNIGSFCSIADNVIIGGAMHPTSWISSSPVFCKEKNILSQNFANNSFVASKQTNIGHDVWICNNALIKQGINIGNGAIIGMGSVVTKDVEPYSIVAGNPARLIRKRFDDNTINKIEKIRWFDFSEKKLKEIGHAFNDINLFLYLSNE